MYLKWSISFEDETLKGKKFDEINIQKEMPNLYSEIMFPMQKKTLKL